MTTLDNELAQLFADRPDSLTALAERLTADMHQRLRQAIELRKFEDGTRLSDEQLENCMQLVILYESKYLPETRRTGFDFPTTCKSQVSGGQVSADAALQEKSSVQYWNKE